MHDGGRLLVVDDNPSNRDMLSRRLIRWGYTVTLAEDGRQALEEIRSRPYDLILLDIMMPDLNGYEVLERIKADEASRHLPVLMISAIDELDSVVRCIELGADDYLPKPFNPILLRARVEASLAKKRLYDRERRYAQSMERELEIGRQIQQGFLPAELPHSAGWEIAARFCPASQVAGDFYDAFDLPTGHIGLVIADVCGKGVGAALFMALVRSLIRAFADRASRSADPDTGAILCEAVTATNEYITRVHRSAHMFASVFFGLLDPETGALHYINAGHEPPAITGPIRPTVRLGPTGPAVGLLPSAPFSVATATLSPGELMLAFTDGATEARDAARTFFTEERLLAQLADAYPTAAHLLDRIERAVHAYAGDTAPSDDLTLLALRRAPDGTPAEAPLTAQSRNAHARL